MLEKQLFRSSTYSDTTSLLSAHHHYHTSTYTQEFYRACLEGDFELALCLLKMGVNLNVRFENGQNMLQIACMKNFYGLVQLLIKFGCNEFMRDNFGRTALHYAVANNSTSIVRYLVEKNTFTNDSNTISPSSSHSPNTDYLTKQFLNTQDVNGKTAIHLACENNFKEPILIMVSSGQADLNLEDEAKQTPLMISYSKSYWEIFELLLKNGAIINRLVLKDICVRGNMTALNILQRYFNNKSLASLIFEQEIGNHTYLYLAMKYCENLDFVNRLFETGCKMNRNDLIDFYSELKMFKYLSKTIGTASTFNQYLAKFASHLEHVILLFKHYSFGEAIIFKEDGDMDKLKQLFVDSNLDFDEIRVNKTDVVNHFILFYLNLIYEIYSHLYTLKIKSSEPVSMVNSRMSFLFALAIFSSQLDCKKKFVRKWFETSLNTGGSTSPANQSKLSKTLGKMYNESVVTSPWSLQALCRSTIRTEINNMDYVLSDRNLIKNLQLPDIYVRYLKFEFI